MYNNVIGLIYMKYSFKAELLLDTLTVFRGILSRSVMISMKKLLSACDKKPSEFLGAYGEFFRVLSDHHATESLAGHITRAALYDENIFTLAAAAGRADELPENIKEAVKRDCESIIFLANLDAESILNEYTYINDIREIADTLPRWSCGKVEPEFENGCDFDRLCAFCKQNGCGIFARWRAFIWRDGDIRPVEHPDKISLDSFIDYERQRQRVLDNTLAFINGKTCNNCLLYGDMGTGKSSTVKALGNELRGQGLRVVEMPKERLSEFPLLVDKIAPLPLKFIIFIDDLSFQSQDKSYTSLKAVLEGGLAARPSNALIYATSNRRHLIKESWADRDTDDIHRRDNMQETLSLSDRFGLAVNFGNPDKAEFLEIVYALAERAGVTMKKEELAAKAERFALSRGGRSPRCAKQFVESLAV